MNPPNPEDVACSADWEMLQCMVQGSRTSRHVEHAPDIASAPLPIVPENESFSKEESRNVVYITLVRGKRVELRLFPREERLRFLEWEEDDPKQRPPGYSLPCQISQSRQPPQHSHPLDVLKDRAPLANPSPAGDGNKHRAFCGQPPQSSGIKQHPSHAQPFSVHGQPTSLDGNNPHFYRSMHSTEDFPPHPAHLPPLPGIRKLPTCYERPVVDDSKPIPGRPLGKTMMLHYDQSPHPNEMPHPSYSQPNATEEMLYNPDNDPPPPFKLLNSDYCPGIKPANVSTLQKHQFQRGERPVQIPDPWVVSFNSERGMEKIPDPQNPNFRSERDVAEMQDAQHLAYRPECEVAQLPYQYPCDSHRDQSIEQIPKPHIEIRCNEIPNPQNIIYHPENGFAHVTDPHNLDFCREHGHTNVADPRYNAGEPGRGLVQSPYPHSLNYGQKHWLAGLHDPRNVNIRPESDNKEIPNSRALDFRPRQHGYPETFYEFQRDPLPDLRNHNYRAEPISTQLYNPRNLDSHPERLPTELPEPCIVNYRPGRSLTEFPNPHAPDFRPDSNLAELPNSRAVHFCKEKCVYSESFQEFFLEQKPDLRNQNYRAEPTSTQLSNPWNYKSPPERMPTELPINFHPESGPAGLPNPCLHEYSSKLGIVQGHEQHLEASRDGLPVPQSLKFDLERGMSNVPDPWNSESRTERGVAEIPCPSNLHCPPEIGVAQIPAPYAEFRRDPRWTYEYVVVPVSPTPVKLSVRGRGRIPEGAKEFPRKDTLARERRLMADFGIVTDVGPAFNEPRILVMPFGATQVPPERGASGRVGNETAAACDRTPPAAEPQLVSDFGIVVHVGRMPNAAKNATASLEEPVPKSESTSERHDSQKPALQSATNPLDYRPSTEKPGTWKQETKSAPKGQDCRRSTERPESRKPEVKSATNAQDCRTSGERPESRKLEAKSAPNGQVCSATPSKLDMKQRNERKRCGGFQVYVPPPLRNEREKLSALENLVSKSRVSGVSCSGSDQKVNSANEKDQHDSRTREESWDLNSDSEEKLKFGLDVGGHSNVHLESPAEMGVDGDKRRPNSRGTHGTRAEKPSGPVSIKKAESKSIPGKVDFRSKLNSNVSRSDDEGYREPTTGYTNMKSAEEPKRTGTMQAADKIKSNAGSMPKLVLTKQVNSQTNKPKMPNRDESESNHVGLSESTSSTMEPKCGGTLEATVEKLGNKDIVPKSVPGEEAHWLELNLYVSRSKMTCHGGFIETNPGALKPILEMTAGKCQSKGALPKSIPRVETRGMERKEKARGSFCGNFRESKPIITKPEIRGTPELTAEEFKSGQNNSAVSKLISRDESLSIKHNVNVASNRKVNESPRKSEGHTPNLPSGNTRVIRKPSARKFVTHRRPKINTSTWQVSDNASDPLQKTKEEMPRSVSNIRGNAGVFPSHRKDIPRQSVECTTGTRGSTGNEALGAMPKKAQKPVEPNGRTGGLAGKPARPTTKPGGEISSFVQPRNVRKARANGRSCGPQTRQRQMDYGAGSEHQDKEPEASGQEPVGKEGATGADSGTQATEGGADTFQEAAKEVSVVKLFPDLDMEHQCLILPFVQKESGALFADLEELVWFGAKSPSYN